MSASFSSPVRKIIHFLVSLLLVGRLISEFLFVWTCLHCSLICPLFWSVSNVVSGKSTLNTLIGIRFPSLPVSIFYSQSAFVSVFFVFSLAMITNCMLWKLKTFDHTMLFSLADTSESSLSWHITLTVLCLSCLSLLVVVYCGSCIPLRWLLCSHLVQFSQMLDICEAHVLYCSICISVRDYFFNFCFTSLLDVSSIAFCTLCTSLLGPLRTYSLVTLLVFLSWLVLF